MLSGRLEGHGLSSSAAMWEADLGGSSTVGGGFFCFAAEAAGI